LIEVLDDVLSNPDEYRKQALSGEFHSVSFGPETFHGIQAPPTSEFAISFQKKFPEFNPVLTFLRKSPLGQVEPNFIHNDAAMGDVTAILYLNPEPPREDGTRFYKQSGNNFLFDVDVRAKFNRAVVFSADIPHSRSIHENYGDGDSARLIQVLFARKAS
jgi:hypothetical protein